ncbi:MAG TPA: hypothetical protein VLE96_00680 [Chlamydiales bacterium]|nr:hypothetical protein [Chlamydiales bacterium]
MQNPIQGYRKELRLLEEMEGERLAEWTFSEVKEKLIQHEIPWEKLPSLNESTKEIPLPSMKIDIPGSKPKEITRAFTLYCNKRGEKMGPKGEIYRMIHVDIHFSPRLSQKKKKAKGRGDYSYKLIVQRI